MRRSISSSLGAALVGAVSACTLVPNPALEGGESTSGVGTSTGEPGTSTGESGTSTSDDSASDGSESSDTGIEPVCGNGIVEAPEACDEQEPTATCDEDCTPVECGDGLVNVAAGEACDGGGATAACNADCTVAACGDGNTNMAAGEQCDDAGATAACDADCTLPQCGDGLLNETAGEACDQGGETAACNQDCSIAACGDGITNVAAGEQCDDMGRTGACNIDCTLTGCGDGVLNVAAGEQCDEAGETAACDVDCTPVVCGDGITNVTAGEACDGGGETAACNADCTVAVCGDGITNSTAAEDCDDSGASGTCDGDCTGVACGDAILNDLAGEVCEVTDLAGESCEALGYGTGTLACPECTGYDASGCTPSEPALSLSFSQVKRFDFSWGPAMGAEYYQLLERAAPGEPLVQVGGDVVGELVSLEMPLHLRQQASYRLRACNGAGCTDSAEVPVVGSLAEAVGYVKASNTGSSDEFGRRVALSADGSTLAVGAQDEDSNASNSGAVYVYTRDGLGAWSQQAFVKAANAGADDWFGGSVALSADGSTLAVGATHEDSIGVGVNSGNEADDTETNSGAVYVYTRDGLGVWSQQAYVKASNTEAGDGFGSSVVLSADGSTLGVGAWLEDSNATGVGNDQLNNLASNSGAVYVYTRDGLGAWSQQAYVKASNTGANDFFSPGLALSGDGSTLAVGAYQEDSNAMDVGNDQLNSLAPSSGAVYVYTRDGLGAWSQQAYVKASNTEANDRFGANVALSGDGSTLAVGARLEDSNATGVGNDQGNNLASSSGAVYVYTRDGLGVWSQQAYVKASNTEADDEFASSVALSEDGSTLAVGASGEESSATGVGGDQVNNLASSSGAVYVYTRDGLGTWSQQSYVKASNTGANDLFGEALALSADGSTLAVGAYREDSSAPGIGGDQSNDFSSNSGAVYLY